MNDDRKSMNFLPNAFLEYSNLTSNALSSLLTITFFHIQEGFKAFNYIYNSYFFIYILKW